MSKNRLAILPNVTHYDIAMAPELVTAALAFLDAKTGPSPAPLAGDAKR
jgi:hypothetical protein